MRISWRIVSIFSRFAADAIGMVQTIIIAKLLPVGDYGLMKLVVSITAVVGVYQHLGLSSGSTREIASAKDPREAYKVFIASVLIRYMITLPVFLVLFFGADYIGGRYYNRPVIVLPLQILALTMLIEPLKAVLNSVVQGRKKFGFLFSFQVVIAVVSLLLVVGFIAKMGFMGYFYAQVAFVIIYTLIMAVYVYMLFKGHTAFPDKRELFKITKAIFAIGLYAYLIKILFVQWQNLGNLVLGKNLSDEAIGVFAFGLMISMKLVAVTDAINVVDLPTMTELYEKSKNRFQQKYLISSSKAFIMITFFATFGVVMRYIGFRFLDYIFSFVGKGSISEKFATSLELLPIFLLAAWLYGLINLLNAGLAVPTKKMRGILITYIILFVSTFGFYWMLPYEPLLRFAVAMVLATAVSYTFMLVSTKYTLGFFPITKIDLSYVFVSLVIVAGYYIGVSYIILMPIYIAATYVFYKKIKAMGQAENLIQE